MTTLISFIGIGIKPKNPATSAHYQSATYRFEDGFTATTNFFGWAALQYLRQCPSSEPPTRWLILGTATSGWGMLEDLALESESAQLDRVVALANTARAEVAAAGVTQATLQQLESELNTTAGVELYLRVVEDNTDEIFGCLHDNLAAKASVILDVTHGFRTMPIHALISLGALRWMKGITIANILYGALDKPRGANGSAPAVSLHHSSQLARATPGLAAVHINADLEAVSIVTDILGIGVPSLQTSLNNAHVFQSMMHGDRADNLLRSDAVRHERHWNAKGNLATLAAGFLRDNCDPGPSTQRAQREFLRARKFFHQHDYMRAVLLLCESISRHAVDTLNLQARAGEHLLDLAEIFNRFAATDIAPLTADTLHKLRLIRNAIAHIDEPDKRVRQLFESPDKLRMFLTRAFSDTHKALFPRLPLD